jgi:hypothetical protein
MDLSFATNSTSITCPTVLAPISSSDARVLVDQIYELDEEEDSADSEYDPE